jgi:hypothetical protein
MAACTRQVGAVAPVPLVRTPLLTAAIALLAGAMVGRLAGPFAGAVAGSALYLGVAVRYRDEFVRLVRAQFGR